MSVQRSRSADQHARAGTVFDYESLAELLRKLIPDQAAMVSVRHRQRTGR